MKFSRVAFRSLRWTLRKDHESREFSWKPGLTSVAFSPFGFIIGVWAKTFEQLAIIPSLVVTPLTFLGGAFYSIDMPPPF